MGNYFPISPPSLPFDRCPIFNPILRVNLQLSKWQISRPGNLQKRNNITLFLVMKWSQGPYQSSRGKSRLLSTDNPVTRNVPVSPEHCITFVAGKVGIRRGFSANLDVFPINYSTLTPYSHCPHHQHGQGVQNEPHTYGKILPRTRESNIQRISAFARSICG
jgi:hypothetical protein